MKRGNVVIADFPFQDASGSKLRPAIVVQNDVDNLRLANTIVAMVTGNLRDAARSTNLFIDPAMPEGASSGLHGRSVVKCSNLATIRKHRIIHTIGNLSDPLKQQLDACLKAVLELQ